MRIIHFSFVFVATSFFLITSAATFDDYQSADDHDMLNAFKTFGKRLKRRATNQEKRDISLAYSATNINNKEGTQVKTITVIKNLGDKTASKLKIKPELHKNEDWAQAFKDNFDSYGVIPDVPDVDDLFEYVNRKHNSEKTKKENKEQEKTTTAEPKPMKSVEKPVVEDSSEEVAESKQSVEKIQGDAELLPHFNASRLKTRESLINVNYSTPRHTVTQYFDNYIQLSPNSAKGYNYPKPCGGQQPVSSVTISTPSGRTYNIPENNTNINVNPYLAPAVTRRPPIQQQTEPPQAAINGPNFPINSLLPPLQQQQPQQPSFGGIQTQQTGSQSPPTQQQPPTQQLSPPVVPQSAIQTQPPQQNQQTQSSFTSTTQRPYVAPNLRSTLAGVNRGPASASNPNGFPNGYRINSYNAGFSRANTARSRGLKY